MQILDSLRDKIKYADDKELYQYVGIFSGITCVTFALLLYLHYSRVSWHTGQLKQLNSWRTQTRQILSDAKMVKLQQEEVEEILAKDKDFRIGQAYQAIVRSANLTSKVVDQSIPTTGESISGKTEVLVTSQLRGLSMKEVTDFLVLIAQVPQLYTKELTIKRTPGRSMVDVDITVATLEPSSPE